MQGTEIVQAKMLSIHGALQMHCRQDVSLMLGQAMHRDVHGHADICKTRHDIVSIAVVRTSNAATSKLPASGCTRVIPEHALQCANLNGSLKIL